MEEILPVLQQQQQQYVDGYTIDRLEGGGKKQAKAMEEETESLTTLAYRKTTWKTAFAPILICRPYRGKKSFFCLVSLRAK